MQPQLLAAHVGLSVHAFDIFNHAIGAHRRNMYSATSNSLLDAIKL